MPYFVPANGFTQQIQEFAKQLASLSDEAVQVDDDDAHPTRRTSYLVVIPNAGAGMTTTLDYREEFGKRVGGWLRLRYAYELRITGPAGGPGDARRAHHDHEPWGIHQHCRTPTRPGSVHYADVERLLQATHELFLRQLVSGSPVDCSGLVPLAPE